MHIPGSMIHGAVCPVTIGVAAAGAVTALYFAKSSDDKPSAAKFAAVTSLVFALQMLNYPVQNGTSGHLVGAMLAVALLGVPYAVISMAVVLVVQSVFFADGGINALGANILNMGLLGGGLAGAAFYYLRKRVHAYAALAAASWISVMAGALGCSVVVAVSGAVAFNKVLGTMLGVHALIGMGEALITVVVVAALTTHARVWKLKERAFAVMTFALAVIAAMLSPFASNFPDGLEWVAGRLSFAEFAGAQQAVMFPDYQLTWIGDPVLSVIGAGLAGIALVTGISLFIMRVVRVHA
jgi:cobalt/nickel transport system permease protein